MSGLSLKSFVPKLAALTGMTPLQLYERQRSLARAGLVVAGGRGPGMGLTATAPSIALLLISVLSSDSLSESEARVGPIADLKPAQPPQYPSWNTFLNAVAVILSRTGMAAEIRSIEVFQTSDRAIIRYYDTDGAEKACEFKRTKSQEPGIIKSTTLTGGLLQQIAAVVQAALIENFDQPATARPARPRRKKTATVMTVRDKVSQ